MPIDALTLAKQLIERPSVTPTDAGAQEVLQQALESLNFSCTNLPFEEEDHPRVENLYARFGKEGPHLCFAGHTDVVPAGNKEDWQYDPFTPHVVNDVLYGRGVVDMKTSIACFVSATSRFLENNPEFSGSISFLITGDEEGDAVNGTKKMLEHLSQNNEQWDGCIVGEPTSDMQLGDTIKIGRRGSVNFDLTVYGKQGHVAYPQFADNPITRLNRILHALDTHNLDEGNEYFQPSNLEIVNIHVDNDATNVIPAKANARFNIRFNDKHKSATLIKWIHTICGSMCDDGECSYEIRHRVSGEAFLTKPGHLSQAMQRAIKKITGIETNLSTSGGTSDARFIKDYCPVVEMGLLNATAHKIDECASLKEISMLTDIYEESIIAFFA